MTIKRIAPQPSLTQIVADQVREAIMTGSFRLGENISEDRLVAQFGVSRTPIRDAMALLSKEGLVVVRPKKGSFVFETSLSDIEQLCDYRQFLEIEGVHAALRVSAESYLSAMQAILNRMDAAMREADHLAYSLLDNDFHRAAFEHCGNSYLSDAFGLVAGRISALRSNVTAPYDARRTESLEQHHAMHDMLKAGDMTAFVELLALHIQNTKDVYREALADGHLGPPSGEPNTREN
ncbi:GntR family transcriptional regulator [Puniceibacterium confluentis]|uniref:GntR family transcriptional regulator n=1 Tax=Puniceibacterium confluentis TaxID=1958944 RepID=UPI0035662085